VRFEENSFLLSLAKENHARTFERRVLTSATSYERLPYFFEFFLNGFFWVQTNALPHNFPALKDHERGNTQDIELLRSSRIGINLQGTDFEFFTMLFSQLLNDWTLNTARPTPGCPKIDQDGLVGFHDLGIEVVVGKDVLWQRG